MKTSEGPRASGAADAGRRHATEPKDELLETRVMKRILGDVLHGASAECVEAETGEERAFARRVQQDVEEGLAEAPDEGTTSFVEYSLGRDFDRPS